MRTAFVTMVAGAMLLAAACRAEAQHLWWDTGKLDHATCLYGEITVLATHDAIYYCGANWHPGEAAGGYCGIQHNGPDERCTIFSIWDTSPKLHPKVTEADAKTVHNRFGGEGEGAHTHMPLNWKAGDTFQFFVQKSPGAVKGNTDARYYIYDRQAKKWRHLATIASPNGDNKTQVSVATISGGGLASFLENYLGKDRDVPKLAVYRLWLGNDLRTMKPLVKAVGDGTWGQLHDTYFLAEGNSQELKTIFAKLQKKYGKPVFGEQGKPIGPISEKPLSAKVVKELRALPRADEVQNN
jgi:hypothetical protein